MVHYNKFVAYRCQLHLFLWQTLFWTLRKLVEDFQLWGCWFQLLRFGFGWILMESLKRKGRLDWWRWRLCSGWWKIFSHRGCWAVELLQPHWWHRLRRETRQKWKSYTVKRRMRITCAAPMSAAWAGMMLSPSQGWLYIDTVTTYWVPALN